MKWFKGLLSIHNIKAMRFLNKYTIKPSGIPKYTDFNSEFVIQIDKKICKLILDSDDERLTPEMKSYFQTTYDMVSSKTGKLKVKYEPRNGVGRRYAEEPKTPVKWCGSLLIHSKYIKNTIFKYLGWKDYDQKKGHPTILLEIGTLNKLSMKAYDKYIEKFDEICDELIDYYSVEGQTPITKGDVKDLFNITIYGGGHSKWTKNITHEGLTEKELLKLRRRGKKPTQMKNTTVPHEFYNEFLKDTKAITDKIWVNNDALRELVCKEKDGTPMVDDSMNSFSRIRNKLMSQFCGIIENEITYRAYKYVCDNHKEIKKNVDWGYDGFTIPQTNEKVDIDAMNQYVRDTTKFKKVCFIEKSFDPKYVLTDIINQRRSDGVKDEEDEFGYYDSVNVVKLVNGCSEYNLMDILTPVLKDKVVFCNKLWWGYNTKTGLWVKDFIPTNLIMGILMRDITNLRRICENNPTAENNDIQESIGDWIRRISEYKTASNVVKLLCSPLSDEEFEKRLDNSLYKMVFKNGVWDLKTLEFREGFNCDDYITQTIPYDFEKPSEEEEEEFMKEMKKICNWNQTHLEYMLSQYGYAMTSDSSREQMFLYLKGVTASNGKSMLYESLCDIMPNYVKQGSNDMLDKGADLRKDIHSFRGLKILWLDELSTKIKDEDVIKAFANGTSYIYKPLYSVKTVQMPVTCKIHVTSNNTINIKGDNGIERRFILGLLNSQFRPIYTEDNYETCEFVMNKDMRSVLTGRLRNAMIWCIGKYSQMYWQEGCLKPYPDDWESEKNGDLEENNKFKSWFFENYEIDDGGVTYKTEIDELIKIAGAFKDVNVKDEIKRLGIKCVYNSQIRKVKNGKRQKGEYIGFRKINDYCENNE